MTFRIHFENIRIVKGTFLIGVCFVASAHGMTVGGPITASSVNASGSVTLSSMTVNDLTVTHTLNTTGVAPGFPGNIVQMQFSSTTTATDVTSTAFQPVSGLSATLALSDSTDYVRISLSGSLFVHTGGNVTIYRGSTNLGQTNSGLISALPQSNNTDWPVVLTMIDAPGDTIPHTYQAYINSNLAGSIIRFVDGGVGYLLIEEVHL